MRIVAAILLAACLIPTLGRSDEAPASCPFGPGDLPITTNPAGLHGAQIPIEHIIVLMQENRSFDHYFSTLHARNNDIEKIPRGASNPNPVTGKPIRPFHQSQMCETADLDHGWNHTHQAWNNGAMDGFTTINVDPTDPTGRRAMGYYKYHDLPFYFGLYSTFAISDRHFCSLLGPTHPNRHYLLAGTSFGLVSNTFPSVTTDWSARTIFEELDDAGVTWKTYNAQLAFAQLYAYVRDTGADNLAPIANFFTDAAAGTLPQVTYIDPAFFGDDENDEHPPSNAQKGQKFVADIVQALFASPLWSSSALIITYDEHGGFWDHVPPPPACEPDDTLPILKPNDVMARFDRYGVRVPLVVVSPYSRRKYVSHTTTDQTSVLRFIQTRFDLPALTRRDANASALLEMFDFDHPSFLTPPSLPPATINPVRAQQCR